MVQKFGMKKEIPKNGLHTEYYESGQIKGEGNYKDGKLDGKWTNWYENGEIEQEATFKDGKCISGDCNLFD